LQALKILGELCEFPSILRGWVLLPSACQNQWLTVLRFWRVFCNQALHAA